MQPFTLIDRYFWLVCILVTAINYSFAVRVPPVVGAESQAQRSRRRILIQRGFALSTLPWLVMGLGILAGHVDGLFAYFDPKAGNTYVWAWYASVFALSCSFCYWVFVHEGAKEMVELKLFRAHGLRGEMPVREGWIKLFAAAGPPFVVLWVWMVSMMELPK